MAGDSQSGRSILRVDGRPPGKEQGSSKRHDRTYPPGSLDLTTIVIERENPQVYFHENYCHLGLRRPGLDCNLPKSDRGPYSSPRPAITRIRVTILQKRSRRTYSTSQFLSRTLP